MMASLLLLGVPSGVHCFDYAIQGFRPPNVIAGVTVASRIVLLPLQTDVEPQTAAP